jgi:hypothetical protein
MAKLTSIARYAVPALAGLYVGIKAAPAIKTILGTKIGGAISKSTPAKAFSLVSGLQVADEVLGLVEKVPLADKILKNTLRVTGTIPTALASRAAVLGFKPLTKIEAKFAKIGASLNKEVTSPIADIMGLESIARYNNWYSNQLVKEHENIDNLGGRK